MRVGGGEHRANLCAGRARTSIFSPSPIRGGLRAFDALYAREHRAVVAAAAHGRVGKRAAILCGADARRVRDAAPLWFAAPPAGARDDGDVDAGATAGGFVTVADGWGRWVSDRVAAVEVKVKGGASRNSRRNHTIRFPEIIVFVLERIYLSMTLKSKSFAFTHILSLPRGYFLDLARRNLCLLDLLQVAVGR